jgi:hypothetical protein
LAWISVPQERGSFKHGTSQPELRLLFAIKVLERTAILLKGKVPFWQKTRG